MALVGTDFLFNGELPDSSRCLRGCAGYCVFPSSGLAAQRPVHPLGKSMLAYVVAAKYADALPLYRLETILNRYGGSITRTTMANWIIRLDDAFKPPINLMREHQLDGDYVQADETRLQVLKEIGKVATSDSWMWLIRGGQPVVLDASRSE